MKLIATPESMTFEAALPLQSGASIRGYSLSYETYGTLNADKSNAILYPTSDAAQHDDIQHMVREGGALDPSRHFIIIANLFGNGLSSSPSNTPWPDVGTRYPDVTCFDAVQVQRRMLQEVWGIDHLALVYGWSMGAMALSQYQASAERAKLLNREAQVAQAEDRLNPSEAHLNSRRSRV